MLTIGITGGIGSGKTTVSKVFRVLGIPVFQADLVAGKIQNEDPGVKSRLMELFGPDIYSEDGLLNRKKLAGIIFNDRNLLEKINHIIHPAVHQEFIKWKAAYEKSPYLLYEAAIIFETGSFRNFDRTILVVAAENERIQRVLKRDQTTVEAIIQRMHNQLSDSEKMKMADFIIENNDDQMVIPQILKLDQIFKSNSHVWKMDR
ncbi:MAG TPA: dephospho-CoA kinase [Prolixibacteraceae bacterium]|nr:dephospho-CoA kinase [Prolixibacteraceae bacterium]